MQKLVQGIVDFRHNVRPGYRDRFRRLALEQRPDCLFVACSDSRVVPNLFASSEPGDLFVIRNPGNFVPPADAAGLSVADRGEAAAIEFALDRLEVRDIVICGHSHCGAMVALLEEHPPSSPNLREWLTVGRPAVEALRRDPGFAADRPPHDRLSQLSVLQQIEHLRTYPAVRDAEAEGRLGLHAWWFDIAEAEVLSWQPERGFVPLDVGQTGLVSR